MRARRERGDHELVAGFNVTGLCVSLWARVWRRAFKSNPSSGAFIIPDRRMLRFRTTMLSCPKGSGHSASQVCRCRRALWYRPRPRRVPRRDRRQARPGCVALLFGAISRGTGRACPSGRVPASSTIACVPLHGRDVPFPGEYGMPRRPGGPGRRTQGPRCFNPSPKKPVHRSSRRRVCDLARGAAAAPVLAPNMETALAGSGTAPWRPSHRRRGGGSSVSGLHICARGCRGPR